MIELGRLADLCRRLRASPGRLDKLALLADYLRSLPVEAIGIAVAFLIGRAFPASDPRVLGVRGLPAVAGDAAGPPLSLADVAAAFAAVADAGGAGSRRSRDELLRALAVRASPDERQTLQQIIGGEMRTGVSDGLVLDAIARAFAAPLETVRRAALLLGDLSEVATLAAQGGAAALASSTVRPGVPLLPMLAQIAEDFGEVLAAHGGTSALEYKYDGARIQLHRDGERVGIWTRRLSDVTASLPDVVETARRELTAAPFILDGEVLALDAAGRPLPFQDLMRRFRRVHEVERLVREMPLTLHFFDCLMADGRSLIDQPYARRWEALAAVTGRRHLAERTIVTAPAAADEFMARALAAGHEGVVAKDLRSGYEPGGRGKRWFKLKAAETVDCVIVAVDRGSGRRSGWLSNYHLAVRDGDTFADVGKTFKGFTDRQFAEMTEQL
jgi:DNA ligase-1